MIKTTSRLQYCWYKIFAASVCVGTASKKTYTSSTWCINVTFYWLYQKNILPKLKKRQ